MASSQSPNRVFFTSFDRQSNETNTDFTISFDTPIQNAYNYEVVQASFPNLFKSFAKYETILYFYHEDFNSGLVAVGIPLSPAIFVGKGEPKGSRPAGREAYINERYFEDGTQLATYLTAWLASIDADYPDVDSGLQPFFHQNDDPRAAVVQLPTNTTGITFANLSFTFDDLTGDGTLSMKFADSTPKGVRIASIIDTGVLTFPQPSQLGFKLGYTTLEPAAFGADVVTVTTNNNQFALIVKSGTALLQPTFVIPANDYSVEALAVKITEIVTSPVTNPSSSDKFVGFTATESAGVLSLNFPSASGVTEYALNFHTGPPSYQACKTLLGFIDNTTFVAAGGTITAPGPIVVSGTPLSGPDDDFAPDTINLIRTANVYFAASLSSGESLASGGRKDILFAVPLTSTTGAIQVFQSTLSGIVVNRPPSTIRNISMKLLDDNFQILEPLPQNASVTVEVHFAYQEDAKASHLDRQSTNIYS